MANVPPPGQEELDKKIGIRIQQAMIYKNFTDDELAKIINVNRVNITRYRNGQRQCPTSVLVKIADACDVTADFLLGITDVPNRDIRFQSVPAITGLSAEATRILNEWNTSSDDVCDIGRILSLFLSVEPEASEQFFLRIHDMVKELEQRKETERPIVEMSKYYTIEALLVILQEIEFKTEMEGE